MLVHLTQSGAECLKSYYWDYLDKIQQRLRPEDHPEYDVMIAAIDQALAAVEQATDTVTGPTQDS